MISLDKLEEKLTVIEQQRSFLDDYIGVTYLDFTSEDNTHSYYGALHHLQLALQASLDIGQHIVAHDLLGKYKENKEVFRILAANKVLTKTTGEVFAEAIGVRNILVHQYEEVNPEVIYNIIQNNLTDFDKFVVEVKRYLDSQTSKVDNN